ncbi:hypothetical protein K8S19_07990 [bacterium]|nr:hypothetical protein [bacterium]
MISRDEAVLKAKVFLKQQPWHAECDEATARVIESNEYVNILFRYRAVRKPQEIMIGVNKKDGGVEVIQLG